MSLAPRKPRLAVLVSGIAIAMLAATLLAQLVSSGSADPGSALALISDHPSVAEGPGGRMRLERWTVRDDRTDQGLRLGFATGKFSGRTIGVPDVLNALPVTWHAGRVNFEGSLAWYRTNIPAPHGGVYALRFQSVNFLATVWVDGHELGSHMGPYLPFEYRVRLSAGQHTLVVRVDWRNPTAQNSAGFHRTWFNFGGIDGEVNVRAITDSELLDPTIQTGLQPDTPTATSALVKLTVEVRNNAPSREIAPVAKLSYANQTISLHFRARRLAHDQTLRMSALARVEHPALWSPSKPSLYRLTIRVGGESSYSARVGLRQLTWSSGRMYLNGKRLVLHGASIPQEARGQGDALTGSGEDALIAELKAIGANATRSQHPLDPALLERLDAAGILVWQGIGPVDPAGGWSAQTPALAREAERRVQVTVTEDQLHPSIIAWNLTNELAGNGHRGGQAQYVQTMAGWLHSHDPGRMVAVDVWGDHPPRRPGPLFSHVDAVSETDYSGWYESPNDTPSQLGALIRHRLQAMHRTFPGKVQIISEFGAEANSLNASDSPGGYQFQRKVLTGHIIVYAHDPQLSGMLVWNLRDFALTPTFAGGSISRLLPGIKLVKGLDQKGLFDYEGSPKPSAAAVAQLFKALGSG
ncbi:MAG TPA: glycoside hydrolase family 2 TIM barrel-domain containing protein [Solirubrobacteraceae bacterium]